MRFLFWGLLIKTDSLEMGSLIEGLLANPDREGFRVVEELGLRPDKPENPEP